MQKVVLEDKFLRFNDYWTPRIVAESNGQLVKLAKFKGEFDWHHHAFEDELFMVIKGQITIHLKDDIVTLNEGEMYVVPKGVDHKPEAEKEAWVMMVEPKSTVNTGNQLNEHTKTNLEWI